MAIKSDPYTFTNGTVADALEVNARFDELYNLQNGTIDADNMDLTDDYDWIGAHVFSGASTLSNATITTAHGRKRIETIGYGDGGTEPSSSAYTLTIGGEDYYVTTVDMSNDDQITFKTVVPYEYKVGTQLKLRIGFTDANAAAITHEFDSWVGLIDEGDVIDTSINTETASGTSIVSIAAADEFDYSEAIAVTDTSGEINSTAVAVGDVIVGKIEKTSGAQVFRIISMELIW